MITWKKIAQTLVLCAVAVYGFFVPVIHERIVRPLFVNQGVSGMTDETELIESLFKAALVADNRPDNKSNRDVIQAWVADINANWPIEPGHDWRNHLPKVVSENWSGLSLMAKLTAFIPAADEARNENWD